MLKTLNEIHIDKLIVIAIVILLCTLMLCVTGYEITELYLCR